MKKNHYISTAILILTLQWSLGSCVRDEQCDCGEQDKMSLSVRLSFTGSSETRATEHGDADGNFNETVISSLDAFVFSDNTLLWKISSSELTYSLSTNLATLPVPAEKESLFSSNETVSYDLYLVANNEADLSGVTEGTTTLQQLKDLIFQTANFVTRGGAQPQDHFVMEGLTSQIINLNHPQLGLVDMKRAAAKIRLRLAELNVPGYTPDGEIQARLVQFADKSALLDGGNAPVIATVDWKNSPLSVMSTTSVLGGVTTVAPFYAYANEWQVQPDRETYLEMYIPMKSSGGETHTYKYKVPVTPQEFTGEEAEQYMNRIDRNRLYDIAVTVRILGSIEEPPVEVPGNYIIKEWNTQEVLVDIKGAQYLVVSERNVVMPNTSTDTLTFNSSVANVTLVPNSLKATYTYVPAGASAPVTENVTGGQMPAITVQPDVASGIITISSTLPVNYIPKDIEFQITNGQLTETVIVRQLPATYFTVTKGIASHIPGEDRDELPDGNNNPYMYAITTMASAGDIIWGFPPVDAQGKTLNNEEVSRMVSPKFEMTSQFGASVPKSYVNAQTQCRVYTETAEDGTLKTGWRLPTAAEIYFIDVLQQSAPTRYVMRGPYYWSSWSKYPTKNAYGQTGVTGAYRIGENLPFIRTDDSYNWDSGATYSSAHVRCIRDIKD